MSKKTVPGIKTNGKDKPDKIIVAGASAGGFEALTDLCSELPSGFNAALLIVWHTSEGSHGVFPKLLGRKSKLPVSHAVDGENIYKGHIYVAPPNKHLMVEDSKMRVVYGPKENRFRPAIDPLFRSAAYAHDSNVIGVVLTGMLNDGTAGLWAIKDRGGVTIVQNPDDALFNDMPRNALNNVKIDYVVSLKELAALLVKLSSNGIKKRKQTRKSEKMEIEINMALDKAINENDIKRIGKVSEFTCPECNGSLWKMDEGNIVRFRCRTGHAFTGEALIQELTESIEAKLWSTIRGLEESASLIHYLVKKINKKERETLNKYLTSAGKAEEQANMLRKILMEEIKKKN
jgi:two-component system, chemotaxis family, protein-glutamate methylesterase/glutaminase